MKTQSHNRFALVARVVAVLIVAWAPIVLTACNTTEGVGKDVKSLGRGIEDTADKAK